LIVKPFDNSIGHFDIFLSKKNFSRLYAGGCHLDGKNGTFRRIPPRLAKAKISYSDMSILFFSEKQAYSVSISDSD
jgi:hypothetical protein